MTMTITETPRMAAMPQFEKWKDFPDNGWGDRDKKELCTKCEFAALCVPTGSSALSLLSTFRVGRSINMLLCNHCGVAWSMGVDKIGGFSVLTEPLRVQCPTLVHTCSYWGQRVKRCPSCPDYQYQPRESYELVRADETWGGCIPAGTIKYCGDGHVGISRS